MVLSSVWVLPATLLVAALLHLVWIDFYPTVPYAESQWYFEKASELADGLGYVYDQTMFKPTAAWPVGYPLFLSLLFRIMAPSLVVAKLANVALAEVIVFLTAWLAQRKFDRRIGSISALLMATLPGLIVYSSLLQSDMLFMDFSLAALCLTLGGDHLMARLTGSGR